MITDLRKSFMQPQQNNSRLKSSTKVKGSNASQLSNQDLVSVIYSNQDSPQKLKEPDLSRWKTQKFPQTQDGLKKHKRNHSHSNDYMRVTDSKTAGSRQRSKDENSRGGSSHLNRSVDSKNLVMKVRLDKKTDESNNALEIKENRRSQAMNQTAEIFSKPVLEKSVE